MKVFYFIKYFKNGFSIYFDKIRNCIATFTFDLEDSIHDFSDPKANRLLKKKYRVILKNVLQQNLSILQHKSIGIRINSPSTQEFKKDIKFLKDLQGVNWETIIIPKIESLDQIKITLKGLNDNHISFRNIGIFIETMKGMSALKEIITNDISELKYLIFGHADYNLDNKIFPFMHQQQPEYWCWIEKIALDLKGSAITFINSPCLYLSDNDLFMYNLNKLNSIFKENFGQMTLTYNQTSLCNNFEKSDNYTSNYPNKSINNIIEFALELIATSNEKKSDKSFAISNKQYFTCPQEIVMAKFIIESEKDSNGNY